MGVIGVTSVRPVGNIHWVPFSSTRERLQVSGCRLHGAHESVKIMLDDPHERPSGVGECAVITFTFKDVLAAKLLCCLLHCFVCTFIMFSLLHAFADTTITCQLLP